MTAELDRRRREWRERVEIADEGDADDLFEAARIITHAQDEIRSVRGDLPLMAERKEQAAAYEQRRAERKQVRELNALLNTRFTDAAVLRALRRVLRASTVGATNAGSVAREIGAVPTHSDRIRAGQALGRLARGGRVIRLVPRNDDGYGRAHLWSLPGIAASEFALRSHKLD